MAPNMAKISLAVDTPYAVTIIMDIITAAAVFTVLKPIRILLYLNFK